MLFSTCLNLFRAMAMSIYNDNEEDNDDHDDGGNAINTTYLAERPQQPGCYLPFRVFCQCVSIALCTYIHIIFLWYKKFC